MYDTYNFNDKWLFISHEDVRKELSNENWLEENKTTFVIDLRIGHYVKRITNLNIKDLMDFLNNDEDILFYRALTKGTTGC